MRAGWLDDTLTAAVPTFVLLHLRQRRLPGGWQVLPVSHHRQSPRTSCLSCHRLLLSHLWCTRRCTDRPTGTALRVRHGFHPETRWALTLGELGCLQLLSQGGGARAIRGASGGGCVRALPEDLPSGGGVEESHHKLASPRVYGGAARRQCCRCTTSSARAQATGDDGRAAEHGRAAIAPSPGHAGAHTPIASAAVATAAVLPDTLKTLRERANDSDAACRVKICTLRAIPGPRCLARGA
jgi:hypothetical protein